MTIFNNLADMFFNRMKNYKNRTITNKLSDIVSVKDFGAVGDGVTDDTSAIQQAIHYVMTTPYNGGKLYFPDGHYLVSTITNTDWGLELIGSSINSSRIIGSGNGYTIDMSGTNTKVNCSIKNLGFFHKDSTNTGTHIFLDNVRNFTIENCLFSTNTNNAIQIENSERGTYGVFIRDCWFDSIRSSAITLGVNSANINPPTDIYISQCSFQPAVGNSSPCLQVNAVGGLYCTDIDITSSGDGHFLRALTIIPSATQNCNALLFDKCLFDSSSDANMYIGGTGPVTDTTFNNCWFNTSSNNSGIYMNNPSLNGLSITDSIIDSNAQHGIVIDAGTNIDIISNKIYQNSIRNFNTYDGIVMSKPIKNFNISNNSFGHGGFFASSVVGKQNTPTQRYGINIGSTSSDNFIISNNRGIGNLSGLLNNVSSNSNTVIFNNLDCGPSSSFS